MDGNLITSNKEEINILNHIVENPYLGTSKKTNYCIVLITADKDGVKKFGLLIFSFYLI